MRRGFTLVEMLTTVAGLVILLGLMVSLARYVRHRSAEDLTREVLSRMDALLVQYSSDQTRLAKIAPPLVSRAGQVSDEAALRLAAAENNRAMVRFFKEKTGGRAFGDLPLAIYDGIMLRDAWGTPIVYMAPNAANFSASPRSRAFFFSAGPDRKFATALDNQYSYDRLSQMPAGHREQ